MEVKFQETDDLDTQNVITLKIIVSNLQYFIQKKTQTHTETKTKTKKKSSQGPREHST